MPGGLFGSAPKATFSTQSTVQPEQQDLLKWLVKLLEGGGVPAGTQAYTPEFGHSGTYSAPLSGLQNTSLDALEKAALQVQTGLDPKQGEAYGGALDSAIGGTSYSAPKIDSTEAFQKGVVDPLTSDFLEKTLPAVVGKYGAGAGGAYSSDSFAARETAQNDFTRTLASEGSKYAYDASKANQSADVASQGVRQGWGQLLSTILGIPNTFTGSGTAVLSNTLAAGAVPREQKQTQVVGEYGDYLNTINQMMQRLGLFFGGGTTQTQQTSGVNQGGSTGLLSGLLGGVAGNSGLGTAVGTYLFGSSDRRLKEDIEQVGDVDGIPLYKFKYKSEPGKHIGFMAQDVEKRYPTAVVDDARGYKMVNYSQVLESVLAEVK